MTGVRTRRKLRKALFTGITLALASATYENENGDIELAFPIHNEGAARAFPYRPLPSQGWFGLAHPIH